MKLFISAASLLLSCVAVGQQVDHHGGFQVYKISTRNSRAGLSDEDFVALTPEVSSTTQRQHRYQVSSNGTIGDMSSLNWKQTKDQTYIILPATTDVRYDVQTPGVVKVTTASGVVLRYRNGLLEGATDEEGAPVCDLSFNRRATLSQRDFTIASCKNRLVIDAGIGTADAAYANLSAKSKITDGAGRSCVVTNSQLFKKVGSDTRMKSQAQLFAALKAAPDCHDVDISSIATSRSGASGRASTRSN